MYVGSIRKEEPRARTTPQEKPLPPVLAQHSLLLRILLNKLLL